MQLYDLITDAVEYIRNQISYTPSISCFMGTGQESFLNALDSIELRIPYGDIPGMKKASVSSHSSEVVFGSLSGIQVAIWRGRLHFYEGHSMEEITMPVRISGLMGIQKAIFLNAAGGINSSYQAGGLVLAIDHIYLFPQNPLRGDQDDRWGPRFPDMSNVYDSNWIDIVRNSGREINVPVSEGIYAGLMGPSLETPAEYRYLRSIGADMVGMSTLPEVIVAHQMGIQKIILSVISNVVDRDGRAILKTTVDQVIETVNSSMESVVRLIREVLPKII